MFERGSSWANTSKSNHPSFSSAKHVFTSASLPFPLNSWVGALESLFIKKKKCAEGDFPFEAQRPRLRTGLCCMMTWLKAKHAGFLEDQMIRVAYSSSAQCFPWISADVQGFEYVSRCSTRCLQALHFKDISHTISDCFNGHWWRKLDVIYRLWVKPLDLLCCILRNFEGTLLHHNFFVRQCWIGLWQPCWSHGTVTRGFFCHSVQVFPKNYNWWRSSARIKSAYLCQ